MSIIEKLAKVQQELKAPKGQFNDFSKFKYRSCEDILEALKPLLGELTVIISDDIVSVGDRIYVKATVSISDGDQSIESSAFAREPLSKKGMDEAQITGATSSYARKYALNGMFLIDDTKDADGHDNTNQDTINIGGVKYHLELSEIDQQWIKAVKLDPVALEQINDLDYRSFIEEESRK